MVKEQSSDEDSAEDVDIENYFERVNKNFIRNKFIPILILQT